MYVLSIFHSENTINSALHFALQNVQWHSNFSYDYQHCQSADALHITANFLFFT